MSSKFTRSADPRKTPAVCKSKPTSPPVLAQICQTGGQRQWRDTTTGNQLADPLPNALVPIGPPEWRDADPNTLFLLSHDFGSGVNYTSLEFVVLDVNNNMQIVAAATAENGEYHKADPDEYDSGNREAPIVTAWCHYGCSHYIGFGWNLDALDLSALIPE
jgi:hypothetical protein